MFLLKCALKSEDLRKELRSLWTRWKELKPSRVQRVNKEVILTRLQQFFDEAHGIKSQILTLQKVLFQNTRLSILDVFQEFENLEFSKPEFEDLEILVEEVNSTRSEFQFYFEFSTQLSSLLETRWIILRDKVLSLSNKSNIGCYLDLGNRRFLKLLEQSNRGPTKFQFMDCSVFA